MFLYILVNKILLYSQEIFFLLFFHKHNLHRLEFVLVRYFWFVCFDHYAEIFFPILKIIRKVDIGIIRFQTTL